MSHEWVLFYCIIVSRRQKSIVLNATPLFKTDLRPTAPTTTREQATLLFDSTLRTTDPRSRSGALKLALAKRTTLAPRPHLSACPDSERLLPSKFSSHHHPGGGTASVSVLPLRTWDGIAGEEKDYVWIGPSVPVQYKDSKAETGKDKRYKVLVRQYKDALEHCAMRPPRCNFSALLGAICGKMKEIDNKELRHELVRKKRKGHVERCIWDIDRVIQHIDERRFMQVNAKKDQHEDNRGFDEMDARELRENLKAVSPMAVSPETKSCRLIQMSPTAAATASSSIVEVHKNRLWKKAFKVRIKDCVQTVKSDYGVTLQEVPHSFERPGSGTQGRC